LIGQPFENVLTYFICFISEETALHWACEHGAKALVHWLLQNNANVNCQDKDGWYPIHIAAQEGHADIVKILLQHGANVNCQHKDGCGEYSPATVTLKILYASIFFSSRMLF
jgi:ankyrin repeat protein